MESADYAILCDSVSKKFRFFNSPLARLASIFFPSLKIKSREHHALDSVSFSVPRGKSLGIIGRNGAGKSTLLAIISGALQASAGKVLTRGRVASVLELGVGFNQELTGRENALLFLQLQTEGGKGLDIRLNRIQGFAELGEFFDRPIKTYSTGMVARLAFSCSVSIDADVMIIDEALAVGDVRFQAKCLAHLRRIRDEGATILLVAHSIEMIQRNCDIALLLDKGKLLKLGTPREVTDLYEKTIYGSSTRVAQSLEPEDISLVALNRSSVLLKDSANTAIDQKLNYNALEDRVSSSHYDIRVDNFFLEVNGGEPSSVVQSGANISLYVKIKSNASEPAVQAGFSIFTLDGVKLFGANSFSLDGMRWSIDPGTSIWLCFAFIVPFASGDYFIDVGCADGRASPPEILDWRRRLIHFRVEADAGWDGLCDAKARVSLVCER